jgi:tRNA-uridine 2-sulfurtransferase
VKPITAQNKEAPKTAHWLKYFKEPPHVGPLPTDFVGEAGGSCGDLVRIYLEISEGRIKRAAFLANGCPAAIAGASGCAEAVTGQPVLAGCMVSVETIFERLRDIPGDRRRCLELSVTALGLALEKYAGSSGAELIGSPPLAVAMSGGVDSSITAVKLRDEGRGIFGLTLKLHDYAQPSPRACCTLADIDDARSVALAAGFPHLVLDMRREFSEEIIDRFCGDYLAGRTPNPCIDCNRRLRFTHLLRKVRELGASGLATGHYVRITGPTSSGRFELRRARDRSKDQSYMFWAADQTVLAALTTPLGEMLKEDVRELARGRGLTVAAKPDSQDVCFVPDGDYAAFVRGRTGHEPVAGPVIDTSDRVLGKHRGLINYTVGQRRGLGISAADPLYVLALDVRNNRLVVGGAADLARSRFSVSEANFIGPDPATGPFPAAVMTRYNSDPLPAIVHPTSATSAEIELKQPSGPIAPGQSAVFYDGELVLGGGIID